jgi:shikimate kinase
VRAALPADLGLEHFAGVDDDPVRCLDPEASAAMVEHINVQRKANESIGGVFEVRAFGVAPGLGSHVSWEERLDGRLAMALASIQAVKGVGLGDGFDLAGTPGSRARRDLLRRGARVLPRDEPRRRPRGRDDDRRAARRARRAEADPDADQAAALGRHRTLEPAQALRERTDSCVGAGRRRRRRGDGRRSCWPAPTATSSAATTSRTSARRSSATRIGSGGARQLRRPSLCETEAKPFDPVITGFMGRGEVDRGPAVARVLEAEPLDADAVLEQRLGMPIAQFFDAHGEQAFREREEQVVLELLASGAPVVGLGGGAVENPRIRAALREHLCVWIDVDVDTCWRRVQGSARPLARDRDAFTARFARAGRCTRRSRTRSSAARSRSSRRWRRCARCRRARGWPWATTAGGSYPVVVGEGLVDAPWPAPAARSRSPTRPSASCGPATPT